MVNLTFTWIILAQLLWKPWLLGFPTLGRFSSLRACHCEVRFAACRLGKRGLQPPKDGNPKQHQKTRGWDGLLQINGFDISPLMGYKWVIDGL